MKVENQFHMHEIIKILSSVTFEVISLLNTSSGFRYLSFIDITTYDKHHVLMNVVTSSFVLSLQLRVTSLV